MNKKAVRLLTDGCLAAVLVFLWRLSGIEDSSTQIGITFALGVLPLVWLALRHGGAAAIVFGTIGGLFAMFLAPAEHSIAVRVLHEVVPYFATGLAGFFAKYTQKTLNNRRLSSTQLNIVTASLIASFGYFALRYVLPPYLFAEGMSLPLNSTALWAGWIATSVVVAITLIIMARVKPELIIPKRSRYLSRKETSSLLND